MVFGGSELEFIYRNRKYFKLKIKFLESIHNQMKIHNAPLVQFLGNGINIKVTQNSRWGNHNIIYIMLACGIPICVA